MDRREFVKFLALTAAGAAALPEQVLAFERYYTANTPSVAPFIAFDEVSAAGLRLSSSLPVRMIFSKGPDMVLNAAFNAFGGIYFWRAAPDSKIVASVSVPLTWEITVWRKGWQDQAESSGDFQLLEDAEVKRVLQGHVSYIDQNAVRHTVPIETAKGTIDC